MSRHTPPTQSQTRAQVGVLFVCLGNICRSPLARVIFAQHAAQRGLAPRLLIDSCGTGGWHAGQGADPRSIQIAAARGISLEHCARRVDPDSDFDRFRWLVAMDRQNRRDLLTLGAPAENVVLIRRFDPRLAGRPDDELDVPDPYYGGDDGFRHVFDMLEHACDGLCTSIERCL